MITDWKVDDKIVCIRDDWYTPKLWVKVLTRQRPVAGRVYTISEIMMFGDMAFVALREVVNQNRSVWAADHFRKVQPKQSSIDALAKLTAPQPHINVRDLVE